MTQSTNGHRPVAEPIQILAEAAAERQLKALEVLAERDGSSFLQTSAAGVLPAEGLVIGHINAGEGQYKRVPVYSYNMNLRGAAHRIPREMALVIIGTEKARRISEDLGLIDARLLALARELAAEAYCRGDFGTAERLPGEVEAMAVDLAHRWQGAQDDWFTERNVRAQYEEAPE